MTSARRTPLTRATLVRDNGAVTAQLVIFDLDGTLTDSAEGVVASFCHALAAVGAEVPTGDLAARVVGPPIQDTLATLGLDERAAEALTAYRADYVSRGWAMNSLYDGIAELLADLRGAGIRLAVATSKVEQTARLILEHFGIAGHFEVIAGATADGSRATKAEVLGHALTQLGALPDRVIMVGDREHDVAGAAEHGIETVLVEWGYGAGDFTGSGSVRPLASVATVGELRTALGVAGG